MTLCWTYGSVMRASVKGLLGTLIGDLFLAPRHSLLFWTVCVSFDGNHF